MKMAIIPSNGGSLCIVFFSILSVASSASFLHHGRGYGSNSRALVLTATEPTFTFARYAKKEESSKKGYQFGDITKTLIKKVTKKDSYEFGDLSRHLDKVAKQKVAELNQKETYEFGDLTKYIDGKVKSDIQEFTNSTKKYEFGDVSKEIVRRVATRDYTLDDLIFLLKILLAFGAGLSPVANFLPAKLLIQLLDVSIAGEATNRVTAAITSELDKRMKKAFTGDENYKMGDLSKKAVLDYIGKDKYEFGDITKFVLEKLDGDKGKSGNEGTRGKDAASQHELSLNDSMLGSDSPNSELIAKELDEWDKKFLVQLDTEKGVTDDKSDGKGRQRQ